MRALRYQAVSVFSLVAIVTGPDGAAIGNERASAVMELAIPRSRLAYRVMKLASRGFAQGLDKQALTAMKNESSFIKQRMKVNLTFLGWTCKVAWVICLENQEIHVI